FAGLPFCSYALALKDSLNGCHSLVIVTVLAPSGCQLDGFVLRRSMGWTRRGGALAFVRLCG
ncbi:hypothetical protein ACMWP3_25600, partial [Escherichia coli]|uniref:hypothetical protein n=1 Tax=Escherichia coli TaxID=562 RepID=UPI0039E0165D